MAGAEFVTPAQHVTTPTPKARRTGALPPHDAARAARAQLYAGLFMTPWVFLLVVTRHGGPGAGGRSRGGKPPGTTRHIRSLRSLPLVASR